MPWFKLLALVASVPLLGCVTLPTGPGVPVLPGTGKSFEQFRGDDAVCRQFGEERVAGVTPDHAATTTAQRSAVAGAVLGAAAGVAIGGGQGAAIGAGSGLLVGAAVGSTAGAYASSVVQERYDVAYTQCMYAKGNRVPISGRLVGAPSPASYPPPPPGYRRPPPGFPPSPPPS